MIADPHRWNGRVRAARQLRERAVGFGWYAAYRRLPTAEPGLRRLATRHVPADRLLMGYQAGIDGTTFAGFRHDLLWSSRRVLDGPHTALLRAAVESGVEAAVDGDDGFAATPYGRLASDVIRLAGHFFGHGDLDGAAEHARRFARAHLDRRRRPTGDRGGSADDDPIVVRPLATSDCYQVLDGHHRLASRLVDGATGVAVVVYGSPIPTAVQRHLGSMPRLAAYREIHQPLDLPELASEWPVVRGCPDRWSRIRDFLASAGIGRGSGYLDVGARYGWFVNEGLKAGLDAYAVESDPWAPPLAEAVFGIDPRRWWTADATDRLATTGRRWDAVSCLGVLHDLLSGPGPGPAATLMRSLDRATGTVLFLDTDPGGGPPGGGNPAAWTPAGVQHFVSERFVSETSAFDAIVDLGPDADPRRPRRGDAGRLLACVRTRPPRG